MGGSARKLATYADLLALPGDVRAEVDGQFGAHDIVRPDIDGWRRERLPRPGQARPIDVVPDWVCERRAMCRDLDP